MKEFEHINGYYSVPELIRKPVDPIKNETPKIESSTEKPALTNGSATTPETSSADKEATKEDKIATKDVCSSGSNFDIIILKQICTYHFFPNRMVLKVRIKKRMVKKKKTNKFPMLLTKRNL